MIPISSDLIPFKYTISPPNYLYDFKVMTILVEGGRLLKEKD